MHKFSKIYYFIDEFQKQEIQKLNRNIALIYRNYKENYNLKLIKKIRNFCIKQKREFYLSNNIKLALKLDLDGVYLPSFNKLCNYKNLHSKKKFKIIGSAHNLHEIKIKEKQGCSSIFISPIFKTKKSNYFLNIIKFNIIANNTKKKIVALGGINSSNYKKIKLTKSTALASISWIKKNRPK
jgi:thiamine-phosphate pyrophosphorylase